MPTISPNPGFSARFFSFFPRKKKIRIDTQSRSSSKSSVSTLSGTTIVASNSLAMSEAPLSKRARKKQAQASRDAQMSQTGTLSESVASDSIRKDHPPTSTTSSPTSELDGEFKAREGGNPFIEVVQKKVRNLTKRRVIGPFHQLWKFDADFVKC